MRNGPKRLKLFWLTLFCTLPLLAKGGRTLEAMEASARETAIGNRPERRLAHISGEAVGLKHHAASPAEAPMSLFATDYIMWSIS